MTFRAYLDGVEIDASRILLPVDQGFTENADGTAARAGVLFDDPLGDFDPRAWGLLEIEEDSCAQPRIWTGWIISRRISRGPYRDGAGRIWDTDLIDLNELLHYTALQKNRDDAMRPRETGTARIAWVMGTLGMDGIVFDNGQVANNAWIYDETDYRGQYADEVLRDIVSASGVGRWTSYLYWDADAAAGEEVSLFYNDVGAAVRDSTLRLSNVIADVDDVVTFYPSLDASMERDPESQYGGVYVTFTGGRIYRTDPTTIATMDIVSPNGVQLTRDGTYTSDRLINAETANRHAATYLDWHSGEIDTIDVSVQLPADKVNLIGAGMRLEVKFSHIPDHDSFTWTRVASRTITGLSADRSMYTVRLRLTFKGVLQSGGGDPGDTPLPPPGVCGEGSTVLSFGPLGASGSIEVTAGQWVYVHELHADIAWAGSDGYGFNWIIEGSTFDQDTRRIWIWLSEGAGNPATYDWECAWTTTPAWVTGSGDEEFYTGVWNGSLHPGGGAGGHEYWGAWQAPTTGTLEIFGSFGNNIISPFAGYSGSVSVIVSDLDPSAFPIPVEPGSEPPSPGQWVFQEVVTMTGATGTTAFPYAPGSLHVYVSGIPITSASLTETDPSTGDFTLSWTPDADEVVRVDYQGI